MKYAMEIPYCRACRRTHGTPVDDYCPYAKAAVENCNILGVPETNYLWHPPDLAYDFIKYQQDVVHNHTRATVEPVFRVRDELKHQHPSIRNKWPDTSATTYPTPIGHNVPAATFNPHIGSYVPHGNVLGTRGVVDDQNSIHGSSWNNQPLMQHAVRPLYFPNTQRTPHSTMEGHMYATPATSPHMRTWEHHHHPIQYTPQYSFQREDNMTPHQSPYNLQARTDITYCAAQQLRPNNNLAQGFEGPPTSAFLNSPWPTLAGHGHMRGSYAATGHYVQTMTTTHQQPTMTAQSTPPDWMEEARGYSAGVQGAPGSVRHMQRTPGSMKTGYITQARSATGRHGYLPNQGNPQNITQRANHMATQPILHLTETNPGMGQSSFIKIQSDTAAHTMNQQVPANTYFGQGCVHDNPQSVVDPTRPFIGEHGIAPGLDTGACSSIATGSNTSIGSGNPEGYISTLPQKSAPQMQWTSKPVTPMQEAPCTTTTVQGSQTICSRSKPDQSEHLHMMQDAASHVPETHATPGSMMGEPETWISPTTTQSTLSQGKHQERPLQHRSQEASDIKRSSSSSIKSSHQHFLPSEPQCNDKEQSSRRSCLPHEVTEENSSSSCTVSPTEQNNLRNIVRYDKKLSDIIETNFAKLTDTIQLSNLWPHLRQLQVLDQTTEARIKSEGIEPDQIAALLDYLGKNTKSKLHAFFKALCDTDQSHIIHQVLGLNPEDYQHLENLEPQPRIPTKVQKGIASHQEFYYKTLMKGHLLDIEELDLPYDMTHCYIQIIATSDEPVVEPKDIDPDKAMSAGRGKATLKTAVLQGPPGAGKSSFIRHYAYKWSKPSEGEKIEEQKMWDLVVVLHVSTLKLSAHESTKDQILEAISQNLAGSDVDAIIEHLKSKNMDMNVLLVPDGIDECRNDTTLQMLKALVDHSHRNMLPFSVFVTSRSGLCPIKLNDFERRMKIDGFTLQQGLECIKRYYKNIKKPADDSIQDYVNKNIGKLDHILTSPLYTHIFCVVTADGTLKLKKGQRLGLKELFEALEKTIKRRQIEKDGKVKDNLGNNIGEVDIEIQTRRFYMLCLYSLLVDIRTFDDSLLQKFTIHDRNPYFSFMKKKQIPSLWSEKIMVWQFTHEMWHEYLASCGIEALSEEQLKYFLLHICSKPKLRNTQRILVSALGQHQEHLETISDMLIATIMVQCGKKDVFPDDAFQQSWTHAMQRKAQSLTEDPLEILLQEGGLQAQRDTSHDASITMLWNDILSNARVHRGSYQERFRKGKIFSLLYLTDAAAAHGTTYHAYSWSSSLDEYSSDEEDEYSSDKEDEYQFQEDVSYSEGLLSHVYSCLHEVPEENQQEIFDTSIGNLLPCTAGGMDWYATGEMRWSAIKEDQYGVCIHSWSPVDVCQLIQQHGQLLGVVCGNTTWYPTGGIRWSSIEEHSHGPTIHSWSLSDACQLIQQHGQPHHPKLTILHDDTDQQEPQQTQGVTRHQGAAGSMSRSGTQIRHVLVINLYIPYAGNDTSGSTYTDCWGAPPADQLLSPQAWSEMLGEMSRQWRVRAGRLWVWWDESCPISVKGLLDALLLQDTQQYLRELLVEQGGGWRDVRVWDGNITSSDLCEWTRRYTQQSVVRVMLVDLTCNLSLDGGSSREDQKAAVRVIKDTKHGGLSLFYEHSPLKIR